MTLLGRIAAAVDAFRTYNDEPSIDTAGRYAELWSWYAGTWRGDPQFKQLRRRNPRLYQNTRLMWNYARAVVRLYAQTVYMGDLSTDGKPLPDGTRGAIPIDPQTGNDQSDEAILAACAQLWQIWNWRQHMSLRPKMAAILGDCLTELVDDPDRGIVLPRMVWPGYVKDLELDLVGNIKAYAVEYEVSTDQTERYGRTIPAEHYTFRKEVNSEAFRYYKDGKPFAYPGLNDTPVVENPFGFAPAIWDRHELVWGDRGLGAFEAGLVTVRELNSTLSQALDYQRKQFAAPVGIKGAQPPRSVRNAAAVMPDSVVNDPIERAEKAADTLALLPMSETGDFVTVQMDIGKTVEMVSHIEESLLAEFPEARFGQEILEMTQVTAPGVERALGPIIGAVKQARANHDPQTVKLHQMAIAIMGHNLAEKNYPPEVVAARPARYAPFQQFNLDSYGQGLLDFGIPDREVIPETLEERIQRLLLIEQLQDRWSLEQAGVPLEVIDQIEQRREAEKAAFDTAITGIPQADQEAA